MTSKLPQKYQEVAKAIIPYTPEQSSQQLALIRIDPALPCFLCGQPAQAALIAPTPQYASGIATAWLTFPICSGCEQRQVQQQAADSE